MAALLRGATLVAVLSAGHSTREPPRPHILFTLADDIGWNNVSNVTVLHVVQFIAYENAALSRAATPLSPTGHCCMIEQQEWQETRELQPTQSHWPLLHD
jgi:hypothetical protein